MGQLTNQFVSQSYQGLLNLANTNTGLTANLQTVTDGLGGSSPLQISQTQVNISGTFTVNGAPVSVDTGSLVTTSSFNTFTSSVDIRFDGIEIETGSLQNQINQKLDTGSFNTYTSSVNTKLAGLDIETGSLQNQINGLATTGSLNSYTLTSSFNAYTSSNNAKVNELISKTGSYVTETESGSFVTNVYQNPFVNDILVVTKGNGTFTTLTINNVQSSSFANNSTSASFAQNALSASWAPDNSNRNGLITTGSIGGNQSITGSLNVSGTISATSASFTYVNTVYETASVIYSSGSNQFGDASNDTQTLYGTVILPNGPLVVTGSADISTFVESPLFVNTRGQVNLFSSEDVNLQSIGTGSITLNSQTKVSANVIVTGSVSATQGFTGSLQGTASYATNALSSSHAIYADTASFATTTISSSYAENAGTASFAQDIFVVGKNTTGGQLTKGTVVRIGGATGDQALIVTASWEDDGNSANTLGILAQNIANDASGSVITNGTLLGINTSGFTAGDILYLSSSGQYTNVIPPPPYHEVRLGQVLRVQQNNGSMYVQIQNGYELSELHDVNITSPVVGDLLVYRSGSYGQWVNETGTELGFATTGSNTFTGQQNIQTNLNVTGSLIVGGVSSFNDQLSLNSNVSLNGDMFVKSGSQINFNIGDGNDGKFYRLSRKVSGEFGIVQDPGNLHLFDISSSYAEFLPPTYFISGAFATGSLQVRSGSLSTISHNTINFDNYLTSSLGGQSNIILGWSENPTAGGAGTTQANYTGSLRITGSNNIVSLPLIRPTAIGGGTDQQGYISGSGNMIMSNAAGIYLNTGSLLFPKTQNNILGNSSGIFMNFTTSSLAGGHPTISNNLVFGGNITLNSNSGSLSAVGQNAILGGGITSTQNFVTNVRPVISGNNVIGGVTLNHISSSIFYQQNYNNASITINNHLSSSISTNQLTVTNNAFFGGSLGVAHNIYVSGSQNTNAARFITDNLIGGKNNVVSSSFVSSSNSNLFSTIIYGNGLVVSGSHLAGSNGGSAFFGRFNDTGSLHLSQDIVFGVGTGTGASNRRTGFYITSGSLVGVSGSMDIKGVTNALVVTGSQTIQHSVAGQPALTLIAQSIGQPALLVSGTFNVTGSGDHNIIGNSTTITGSVRLSNVLNLQPLNPLPAGNIGDLAVSSSNELYFYNGAWTLVV